MLLNFPPLVPSRSLSQRNQPCTPLMGYRDAHQVPPLPNIKDVVSVEPTKNEEPRVGEDRRGSLVGRGDDRESTLAHIVRTLQGWLIVSFLRKRID